MYRYCCFCENGSIEAIAVCGRRGIFPGDQLPVSVHLENNSGESIDGINLVLIEQIDFSAADYHRDDERVLTNFMVKKRIEPHSGTHEETYMFSIPPVPNPSYKGCIITRSHRLMVQVMIDGACTKDIRLFFPVVIFSTGVVSNVNPDCAPSIFNPDGKMRQKICLGNGKTVAPICVDGFNYNPADQVNLQNPVSYPTFFSSDFMLPQTLQQFNPALHQVLQQNFTSLTNYPI